MCIRDSAGDELGVDVLAHPRLGREARHVVERGPADPGVLVGRDAQGLRGVGDHEVGDVQVRVRGHPRSAAHVAGDGQRLEREDRGARLRGHDTAACDARLSVSYTHLDVYKRQFYDFKLGTLEYRSLRFESELLDEQDHQGVAVVNYTAREVPYTRIIEHKHFEFGTQEKTVITREYPADWKPGDEPYYPINDARNEALYKQYAELAAQEGDVIFAGRLGGYKYYDMDKAIAAAFDLVRSRCV